MQESAVNRSIYLGLFLTAMTSLMYEVLLTRILSVTMFYHFAFLAISVAVLGLTIGTVLVFIFDRFFEVSVLNERLSWLGIGYAASIAVTVFVHVGLPLRSRVPTDDIFRLLVQLLFFTLPFVISGIVIALVLTRWSKRIGRLYAADFLGAGCGCLATFVVLSSTDAFCSIFIIATLAAAASLAFSLNGRTRQMIISALCVLGLAVFSMHYSVLVFEQRPLFTLTYNKGLPNQPMLYEKWNTYSQIAVWSDPDSAAWGWGFGGALKDRYEIDELVLKIDGAAGTRITDFDGDLSKLNYLRYDVVNAVHHLRKDARVLILGVGGGRDILSSLVFEQQLIVGAEYNKDIFAAVNDRYGEFSGHLDRYPNVRFVNAEGRSFIERGDESFDIIMASYVDTFAATAAGAFVLTENTLYTVEAWKSFLEHLSERGVLSFSHSYVFSDLWAIYRMVGIAAAALEGLGIKEPRKHIVLVRSPGSSSPQVNDRAVGTILVSKNPFTEEDKEMLNSYARDWGVVVEFSPWEAKDPVFVKLADYHSEFRNSHPKYRPTTDDRPFFFSAIGEGIYNSRDLFGDFNLWFSHLNESLKMLLKIAAIIVLFASVFIIAPLSYWGYSDRKRLRKRLSLYFVSIGLGFMMAEIPLITKLTVYLGHPSYGLTVALFGLLLGAGAGSYAVDRLSSQTAARFRMYLLLVPVLFLFILQLFLLPELSISGYASTFARILIGLCLLVPLGASLGIALPLGMKLAEAHNPRTLAWLWGINGAMSALSAICAMVVTVTFGITVCLWLALGCYIMSLGIVSVIFPVRS